jgi:hypothetical protein
MGGKGTFGPGMPRDPTVVGELDGSWEVRRLSGALPPLVGVTKQVQGEQGTTSVWRLVRMPFDVRGLELRYRRPLGMFVDVLEPDGDGFRGRATVFGREYGRFELRRAPR